jgi:predicted patatin/cPLA2 family phospholipase
MRVLVCDGGGMRSAFTAGVFAGLKEAGVGHSSFDCYVGSSGGACSMAYFLTDQVEDGLRCWRDHLPGHFMKWKGLRPYNDTEYLDRLFREIEPLSCDILATRREKAIVALADPLNMRTAYQSLNEAKDPVSLLVASATMPFFSPPASVDKHVYYDANLICAIPLRYTDLIDASETWVILTTPHGYRRRHWRWRFASWFAGDKSLRRLLTQRPRVENVVLAEIENRKDLVVIRPEHSLPIHWRNSDRAAIVASIELGKEAAWRALAQR